MRKRIHVKKHFRLPPEVLGEIIKFIWYPICVQKLRLICKSFDKNIRLNYYCRTICPHIFKNFMTGTMDYLNEQFTMKHGQRKYITNLILSDYRIQCNWPPDESPTYDSICKSYIRYNKQYLKYFPKLKKLKIDAHRVSKHRGYSINTEYLLYWNIYSSQFSQFVPELETLSIRGIPEIQSKHLQALKKLKELTLHDLPNFTFKEPNYIFKNLTKFVVLNCLSFKRICLKRMPNLKELTYLNDFDEAICKWLPKLEILKVMKISAVCFQWLPNLIELYAYDIYEWRIYELPKLIKRITLCHWNASWPSENYTPISYSNKVELNIGKDDMYKDIFNH